MSDSPTEPAPAPASDPTAAADRVATHTAELMITPEQTWRMVTDPSMLSVWYAFGGATIEPEPGGRFELSWEPGKVFRGRVEVAEAPHRLAYRLPQRPELELADDNNTRVEIVIAPAPTDGRTTITVTESGFAGLDPKYDRFEAYRSAQVAWIGALGFLVQATGIPPAADQPHA